MIARCNLLKESAMKHYFMKTKILSGALPLVFLFTLIAGVRLARADDAPKSARPNIYDESADGAKQTADALSIAAKEQKHVLLMFGANWCGWCHKLHKLFESDPKIAGVLKSGYVLVMIDVNKGHNGDVDTKYGNPTRFGLPVIVILDADGKQLTTEDSSKLEEGDHHSPEKVLAFLNEWKGGK